MSDAQPHGRITSGIPAGAAALKTLDFIERHLAAWRDDPQRPQVERERELNGQLCKYLNVVARSEFPMVHFHHEEPQGARHAADLSASPTGEGWIEGRQYTKYEPILVVEGKRLPAPRSNRQREYAASAPHEKPAGGIQRFKLGLHGAALVIAGMVGYLQSGTSTDWLNTINRWIDDLASSGDPLWSGDDRLGHLTVDHPAHVSRCESEHPRTSSVSRTIRLVHLWIEM